MTDHDNFAPLHAACVGGYSIIATTLLDAGADVGIQTEEAREGPLLGKSETSHLQCFQKCLIWEIFEPGG